MTRRSDSEKLRRRLEHGTCSRARNLQIDCRPRWWMEWPHRKLNLQSIFGALQVGLGPGRESRAGRPARRPAVGLEFRVRCVILLAGGARA